MQMCIEHAPECSNNNSFYFKLFTVTVNLYLELEILDLLSFFNCWYFFIYWPVSQNEAINKIGFNLTYTKLPNQILKNWSLAFF